jgi:tRNA(Ile)-lysidine synthase
VLGPNTAEAIAREKRYEWLKAVVVKHDADAIVTAHHRDDVIETVIINMMRGTGWRGLASLRDTDRIRRPLLDISKIDIVTYAIENNLQWREDSTNDDIRYLRNYIRHGIMPRVDQGTTMKLIDLYHAQCTLRDDIETDSARILSYASDGDNVSRYWLIMLPDEAAYEMLRQKFGSLTRGHSTRLLHFARCARPGSFLELSDSQIYRATVRQLIFLGR